MQNENAEVPLQAGFTVSTRHFKRAVDRNRIKRLMREAYRLQKNNLMNHVVESNMNLAVFFIYTASVMPAYHDVFEKMGGALEKIEKAFGPK